MKDGFQVGFQDRLSSFLSEMELTHPICDQGQRVSGGRCHLDAESFELLTRYFKRGQYSKGVMEAYSRVIGITRPSDLQRSSQVVRQLRADKGGHIVQVSVFPSELDELKESASKAGLTVAAILECCTYLFVRVGVR